MESALQSDDEDGTRIRGDFLGMLTTLQGITTEIQTQTAVVMLEGPPEITVEALELCGSITRLTAELFDIIAAQGANCEALDGLRQEIHRGTLRFAMHAHVLI
ncbi:hypothetical protein [Streptomyces sp. MK37H]|uniref:hypothetical protein n=1 Tax=Streptomyces sp. MK37H TaxID=2699117 RepID=UPI001B38818F|nr:hypothetical protein [Streptomyces sp. MK37H]MBP8539465.1 hypothetical protein [Streptomyces sp. MK37H]